MTVLIIDLESVDGSSSKLDSVTISVPEPRASSVIPKVIVPRPITVRDIEAETHLEVRPGPVEVRISAANRSFIVRGNIPDVEEYPLSALLEQGKVAPPDAIEELWIAFRKLNGEFYAEEAERFAHDAEVSAQSASSSKNLAQGYKDEALSARTDAVTAGEKAQSKAVLAESFASAAATSADTATGQAQVASGHADAAAGSAGSAAESEKSAKASEQAAKQAETNVKASEDRVATIAGSTRWVGTRLEVNGQLSPDLKGDLPVVYSSTPPEDKYVIWVNPDEDLPEPGTSDLESLEARIRAVEAQLNESPENTPTNKWQPGEVYHGRWRVMYNGYGTVNGSLSRVYMNPAAPEALSQTHAALVTNEQVNEGDLDFVVTVKTLSQTRKNDSPNPWECAWVMWDWTADNSFYAVALKPNGWEISKQDSIYNGNQRYIGSNTTPTFDIGVPYRIWVKRVSGETYVRWAVEDLSQPDGIPATGWNYLWHFTDEERPLNTGKIAFYVEDAEVEFTGLVIR